MKYDSNMTFSYNGWGRNVSMTIEDDDADFLPKVLDNVATFLRAVGFEYVGVRKEDKTYVFHHEYNWKDASLEEETEFDLEDILEEFAQAAINKAAEDYWDEAINKALSDNLSPGDTVFYHGKGTAEVGLNRNDEAQGHGGYHGVSLVNMEGTVVKNTDSVTGPRVLVRWNNWNDGHNGMGDDPDAKMGSTNYWWSNLDNVSKVN
jgi:hypothetical protein